MMELYECNQCGLQLRLFMAVGSACPSCGGTFFRANKARYGEKYQNMLQDQNKPKWEGEPTEFGIERDVQRALEGIDRLLKAEAEMDQYDGEE